MSARASRPEPSRRFHPLADELADLFQRMPMKEIAEHYGVGETVVHKRIHEYGLAGPGLQRPFERLRQKSGLMSTIARSAKAFPSAPAHSPRVGGAGFRRSCDWQATRLEYRQWKTAVLARDGFRCGECGIEQGHVCPCCRHRVTLHAHHVKPFSDNPEIRFTLDNGITLCRPCHEKAHIMVNRVNCWKVLESLDATA